MSFLIQNGRVFTGKGFLEADVQVEDGRIARIGKRLRSEEKPIDATGLLVVPGLIDPHVHFREPGAEYKEDFLTGTQAAVAGGFTAVMDMPNNKIPTTTADRLEEKKKLAADKAVCDVRFHFGTTDSNFDEVKKANPDSLKVYMGHTTGELMLKERGSLERHFAGFDTERPVVVHASDHTPDEDKNLENTYANEDYARTMAEKYKRKIHLAHVSTSHEVHSFKKYARATVEVAPHYLFLSSKDAEGLGIFGTVYPPLRSEQKRITLWNALERIDCIASDHAPHTVEDKEDGARGFPGLETSLALMLDGHSKGLLDLNWAIPAMSENPARIFNLQGVGRIEQGYLANITLVDPRKEWKVDGTELFTKCRWSPFEGRVLKGKVQSVLYKGELIFEEGSFF